MPTRKCQFCSDRDTSICEIEVMGAGGPCPFNPFSFNEDTWPCQFYIRDKRDGKDRPITPDMIKSRRMILTKDIVITGLNPRKTFKKEKQERINKSTKEIKIQHNLTFRPNKDNPMKMDLVDGEYRHRAAITNKFKEVPGFVQHLTDAEVIVIMLRSNRDRDDVLPLEEAQGIKDALDKGKTQAELAEELGMSQPWIANQLRLLKMPKDLQKLLLEDKITPKHAMIILPFVGYRIYDKIVEELINDIQEEGKVTVEELKNNIETIIELAFDIPEEIGILNLDDFGYDVSVNESSISKAVLDRHFDDSECGKCKIPKKIENASGSPERMCLDYDCWSVKAQAAQKAHQNEEAAVLEAQKKKAKGKAGKKNITVISPGSHIWTKLKQPKKGTCCEICGATTNLMAYRSSYASQTVCENDLKKAHRDGIKAGKIKPQPLGKKPSAKELLAKKEEEERQAKELQAQRKKEEKKAQEQEQKAKEAAARQLKRNTRDKIKDEEVAVVKAFDDYLKDVQKEFKFLDDLPEDHIKSKAMRSLLIHLVNNLWSEPNKKCYRKWDPTCTGTGDAIEAVKKLKGSERIVAMLRGVFYQECNSASTVITNYAMLKKKFPQAARYYKKPSEEQINDLLESGSKCPTCGNLTADVTKSEFKDKPDEWIIECCDNEVSAPTLKEAIILWNVLSKMPTKITKKMIEENKGPHNHDFKEAALEVTDKDAYYPMICSKCGREEKVKKSTKNYDQKSKGCWVPDAI